MAPAINHWLGKSLLPPSWKIDVPEVGNICGVRSVCCGWGSWELCIPCCLWGDRDVVQGKGHWGWDQLRKCLRPLCEEHLPWDIGVTPGERDPQIPQHPWAGRNI